MPPKTAKRKTGKPAVAESRKATGAKQQEAPAVTTADPVEQKFVALAEQMGRLIGTVQAKAEGWLDPKHMRDQITRIQDGATDLLSHLGNAAGKSSKPALPPALPGPARPQRRQGRCAGQEASSAAAINAAGEALGRSRRGVESGEPVDSPPAAGVSLGTWGWEFRGRNELKRFRHPAPSLQPSPALARMIPM